MDSLIEGQDVKACSPEFCSIFVVDGHENQDLYTRTRIIFTRSAGWYMNSFCCGALSSEVSAASDIRPVEFLIERVLSRY